MAIASFQCVPSGDYVAHVHNYRKITVIGVDDNDKYLTPDRETIVDDTETVAASVIDAEAVGVTVATLPTSAPV